MRQNNKNRRGRGNSGGNNRRPNARQNFDSNGPSVRIRGTATQVYDKYIALARDAQTSGDPILAENLLQHAEHYYRILSADQENRQRRQQQNQKKNEAKENNVSEETESETAEAEDSNEEGEATVTVKDVAANDANADSDSADEAGDEEAAVAE